MSVGRLAAYKRLDRVVAALPYLPDTYQLVIIGEGEERARIERLAGMLGVAHRVRLLGRVSDSDLKHFYRQARVAITLSEAESFGRTIIEALAHGCKVVCSDIPAFRDMAAIFPASLSLLPATACGQQVAGAIRDASAQQLSRPDLRRYTWRTVATDLMRTYGDIQAAASRHTAGEAVR